MSAESPLEILFERDGKDSLSVGSGRHEIGRVTTDKARGFSPPIEKSYSEEIPGPIPEVSYPTCPTAPAGFMARGSLFIPDSDPAVR